MSMPHPSVFMVPFGCVVCQRQTKRGTSVDIYQDVDAIMALHPAFTKALATSIINTKDDPLADTPEYGDISVIGYAQTAAMVAPAYQAWRLHSRAPKAATPEKVPNRNVVGFDNKVIMQSNWLYYLLVPASRRRHR